MKQNVRTVLSLVLAIGFGLVACASDYVWYTMSSGCLTKPNTSTITTADLLDNVTAYLVDADVMSQQMVLTDVIGGGRSLPEVLGSARLSEATVSAGAVGPKPFSHAGEGTEGHAYFVLSANVDGENLLYFSGYSTIKPVGTSGAGYLVLDPSSSQLGVNRTTTFQGDPFAGAGGGWYGGAVPEPTSGLLVVLGLAVMALKRRYES